MPSGNKIGALSTPESLPMCQLWWLLQIAEAESRSAAMWRSPDIHQEGTLPQGGSSWLAPPRIAVQVTLGGTPITILSVYIPGINHLTTRDLSNLIRNIRDQILMTGDFNGHNYMWGSHDIDTRGEIIERFTDKHNLCILNDGTHTYLKPQAQHVNRPTSTIDLTISTPGLALRSVWEVLPDTHGSDHYPILTSILPSVEEMQPSCDPSHWVFSKANWEEFHDVCLESISEDILGEADPLHSFVEHITKAAN